jgi:predicted TIM-barrel fold metal-dependent hydrolase
MVRETNRIIDADGHVAEDSAAIIARMPQAYRDKAREQPFNPFPPFDHLHAGHLVDMPPGAFNRKVGPKEWLAFLDEVGIEATVLYPTAGVASANIVNPDWATDATRAYNEWLHETYLQASSRFRGLALLPQALINSQAAADELRRAVTQLGMCGAVLPSNSLHAPPLGTPTYFPVYEAANELGCCVAVHGGVHGNMGMDGLDPYAAVHAIGHPLGQMVSLASLIFNAVMDRFPKVRFGFLEGGVGVVSILLGKVRTAPTTLMSCAICAAVISSCNRARKSATILSAMLKTGVSSSAAKAESR